METRSKIGLAIGAIILVLGAFFLGTNATRLTSQDSTGLQNTEASTTLMQKGPTLSAESAPLISIKAGTSSNAVSVPVQKPVQSKRSAFALLSLSNAQNVSQVGALLSNTSIDGVALQIGWTSMETSDEVFNWTTLDTALKTAKDKGKGVTLHIFPGGPFGVAQWLKTAGVKTYTLTDFQRRTHEEALPWDTTYLAQYSQFLKSLAKHISNAEYANTLAHVSVGVPVGEMDLIACRNNMLANVSPYNRTTYLSAWEAMIDAHAAAFPSLKKFISAPVGLICAPDRDTQFFVDVMNYASQKYSKTFMPFAADLTAEGSDRTSPYTNIVSSLGVGYQPIWSSTSDPSNRMKAAYPGSLLQATCKAVSNGADYVEIYAVDVSNTDATIQNGIRAVHDSSLCK